MGQESYLFRIEIIKEVEEAELNKYILQSGALLTKTEGETHKDYREYYYEYHSQDSIIELHSLFPPGLSSIHQFYMRFSILSPLSVVKQTMGLFKKMNQYLDFRIFDTEVYNQLHQEYLHKQKEISKTQDELIRSNSYIDIDSARFIKNERKILKREVLKSDKFKKVKIGGGQATMQYIRENNLYDSTIGYIMRGSE